MQETLHKQQVGWRVSSHTDDSSNSNNNNNSDVATEDGDGDDCVLFTSVAVEALSQNFGIFKEISELLRSQLPELLPAAFLNPLVILLNKV